MEHEFRRNKVRQEILTDKDGVITKKAVFHDKRFNGPQFGDRNTLWQQWNQHPKYNSKRQKLLRGETI